MFASFSDLRDLRSRDRLSGDAARRLDDAHARLVVGEDPLLRVRFNAQRADLGGLLDRCFITSSFFAISSIVATPRLPIQMAIGKMHVATIIATRAVSVNATLSTSFALAVFSSAIHPCPAVNVVR
jgi:hypothetical protein